MCPSQSPTDATASSVLCHAPLSQSKTDGVAFRTVPMTSSKAWTVKFAIFGTTSTVLFPTVTAVSVTQCAACVTTSFAASAVWLPNVAARAQKAAKPVPSAPVTRTPSERPSPPMVRDCSSAKADPLAIAPPSVDCQAAAKLPLVTPEAAKPAAAKAAGAATATVIPDPTAAATMQREGTMMTSSPPAEWLAADMLLSSPVDALSIPAT
mmetsp:Transcript_74866/g.193226  ORF Transcript_74866/g.193226 Transcript_74866/m.193226 type:complete len:209 (-) Transcript_74866:331-957(-)